MFLSACEKENRLEAHVSENRYAVYLGKTELCSIKAVSVIREYPYLQDGLVSDLGILFEVTVHYFAPQEEPTLSFQISDKKYGGELSYNTVSGDYTFSCTLSVWEDSISFETQGTTVKADRMNDKDYTKQVLDGILKEESMQQFYTNGTFLGEIRLRLIWDDGVYYYVGLITPDGSEHAFLTDETGKVLASK